MRKSQWRPTLVVELRSQQQKSHSSNGLKENTLNPRLVAEGSSQGANDMHLYDTTYSACRES